MSESESSLPEFSDDEFTDEEVAEVTDKKAKKPKVDPPLMNRPTTPDDFTRYEPSQYQVFASASDLPNGDGFRSLSDPRLIMYMKDDATGKWFEVGRTERIKDTLDPEWVTRIDVDYFDNEEDECRFEVYNWNKNYTDLKKHDFLGQWSGMFQSIMKGGDFFGEELPMVNQTATGPNKKKAASKIKLGAIPVLGQKVFFQFQFEAAKIDKASKFGKTDAFLEMAVSTDEEGEWVTIHRTEVIKKTVDPQWEKFQLTVNQLRADVGERFLKLSVNHWSKKGPKEVGMCITSFADLKSMKESGDDIEFVMINEEKKTGKKADKYVNSGIVKLTYFKRKKDRTAKPARAAAPPKPAPEDLEAEGRMTLEVKPEDIEDNGLEGVEQGVEEIAVSPEEAEDADEAADEPED